LPPVQPAQVPIESVARLCTDISRVERAEEVQDLLSRAAEVLEASGLVLWVGAASGAELRPAFAHGYNPDVIARIPVVPRTANNAAAAAYRTGTLQLVLSQRGSQSKGAIVAPVFCGGGCIGVLSAEIRGGREESAAVQSLASIFAAQLAVLVASVAATPEQRATGS
jgi:GAF domain-containing protein